MPKKEKQCKHCGKVGHTQFYCPTKPKKPIKLKKSPTKGSTKKPKKKTRSQLVKKLDLLFSRYIRLIESDDNKVGSCVTCGEKADYRQLQNGHFYTRGRYATRWDQDNCHSQCVRCNVFLKGNYINYTRYMIDRYGREFVDELERKSLSPVKIHTTELESMIQYYKDKIHEVKSAKNNQD